MAMTVPRGRPRRAARPAERPEPGPPAELAIGDPDTAITTCPACGRPMLAGTGRCPGCGAHLLMGVPARRATIFIMLGVVIGMLAGGGIASAVVRSRPAIVLADPGAAGNGGLVVSAAPSATAAPAASASVAPTPANRPATAVAALTQTSTVDVRLLTSAAVLRSQLSSKARAVDIASTLRGVAADASLGSSLASRMVGWSDAAAVRTQLAAFYDGIEAEALDALSASITNTSAYRNAAARMLVALGDIAQLDADVQAFAASEGIELPAALPAAVTPDGGSTAP
jgi:hypothetical protein